MDVHFLLEKSRLKLYRFESFFVIFFSRTIDHTRAFFPVTMKNSWTIPIYPISKHGKLGAKITSNWMNEI